MVIAIDGPSGVGKSTVARAVASALGIPHLDTGSYYRMATLLTIRHDVDPGSAPGILEALGAATVDVADGVMLIDGADVSSELRSEEVTGLVSRVSAVPEVRAAIVDMQRDWVAAHGGSAVVEGRDIGTVVFPDAAVKVFLTADVETRARRRSGDPEASGATLAELVARMERRDEADSTRATSPLRPAVDARIIDTSELSIADVVLVVLDLVGAV